MNKQKNPEKTDQDNPEWTAGDFERAMPFGALPESLQRKLVRRGRPRTETPKVSVSIRLSPDVLKGFKATGKGWQSRLDAALREWLKTHRAA
ncbi:MAG: hypothetical protein A3G18_07605 [Rhodospirillales bacterium RIFCSPLOWO2_12_FULL_58_28]|nr:MAG: hypothetical protein A3G18_07605 [Rhodospirillales bacterium RIFCSPLOWO2_12_FULL_58_28]